MRDLKSALRGLLAHEKPVGLVAAYNPEGRIEVTFAGTIDELILLEKRITRTVEYILNSNDKTNGGQFTSSELQKNATYVDDGKKN